MNIGATQTPGVNILDRALRCLVSILYHRLGEVAPAIDYYEQALAIARQIGDRRNEGIWSWNLGLLYEDSDPARAAELMQVCAAYEREIGHPDAEAAAARVEEIRARVRTTDAQD